ncbi:MAG: type II toxin-antitoxin system VapC family toxin [Chloroflexi bacterium]|nr:type II toxin-antitoxin system VapC family toxin [Chloroflexota bacterium]
MGEKFLVDTSAFYAIADADDQFHQRANGIYSGLLDQRADMYTTSYVLVECMALIHRRLGFDSLDRFVDSLRDVVGVVWVDGEIHRAAWDILKSRQGRRLSLVDCTVLVLAEALNAGVFAFDDDFAREGLQVLA